MSEPAPVKIAVGHVDECELSDLGIIDELRLIMKGICRIWAEIAPDYDITQLVIRWLRQARADGAVRRLTMDLAEYLNASWKMARKRPMRDQEEDKT